MARSEYSGIGQERHVLEIKRNGLIVCLDDGSVWDISVGDNTKSVCWYPTIRIVVEENDDSVYPFSLKNLDTAGPDVVRASLR